MDCDVCPGGFDGSVEFFYDHTYKARKEYICQECRQSIPRGTQYKRVGGKCEGSMWHEIVCLPCFDINEVFSCGNGTEWGDFWTSMYDYVFPDLTVSSPCFNKLSIEARAKVTEQWWKWKKDTA